MKLDLDEIYESIWRELTRATEDRRHEYRRLVLATTSEEGIRQRIVILRKVIKGNSLIFYTDTRSQKVGDIKLDNKVHALVYSDEHKIQLSCKGYVEEYDDSSIQTSSWESRVLRDYTTKLPPGTHIDQDHEVDYDDEKVHFMTYQIHLTSIEYLKLSRDGHVRLLLTKNEDSWTKQRLVP